MTGQRDDVQARLRPVQKYRAHAEALRLEAQVIEDQERRRVLLFIADNYENLTDSIEGVSG
jgi:hypothetical protein